VNTIKRFFQDRRAKKSAVKRYTRSTAGNISLVVFLLAGGIFSTLPLIYCVSTSLKPLDELLIFPPRFLVHRPTIGNYTILPDLMASLRVPLSRYIFNSVAISFFTTFVYIFVALMAAYAISKGTFKGRNAIFWTVQFALMFNAYTLAVPQYLIFSKLGLIDTYWIYILPPMASNKLYHLVSRLSIHAFSRYADFSDVFTVSHAVLNKIGRHLTFPVRTFGFWCCLNKTLQFSPCYCIIIMK